MAEEEKDDLGPTEKVDELEGEEPEDVGEPGEGKEEIDYSKMSQDELRELVRQEEQERIAELGLPTDQYDSWEKVGTKLKEVMEDDTRVYGGVKKRAMQIGMTPRQFMDSWEKNGIPPDLKPEQKSREGPAKEQLAGVDLRAAIKELQSDQLQADLRTQFQIFKLKMEAKGETVPEKMKKELEQYLGPVLALNKGNLEAINLYEEALPFYQTGEKVKEEKGKAGKTKLSLLKRQLAISGKKTGGVALDMGKASWEGEFEPK